MTRVTAMKMSETVMTTKTRTIASMMMIKIAMNIKNRRVASTTTPRRITAS